MNTSDAVEQTAGRSRKKKSGSGPVKPAAPLRVKYVMRLFIAGDEPNSVTARKNIKELCSALPGGDVKLEVIDVFKNFASAIEENILVTPALVIDKPRKVKIYGTLQDTERVVSALGVA